MKIETAVLGPLSNNTYLVISEKNNAVVIDPGMGFEDIDNIISKNAATLKYVFLTHGHFDHIASASQLIKKYGARLVVSKKDAEMIASERMSLAMSDKTASIRVPITGSFARAVAIGTRITNRVESGASKGFDKRETSDISPNTSHIMIHINIMSARRTSKRSHTT